MAHDTEPPIVQITLRSGTSLYVSLRGPLEIGRECDGLLVADPQVSRRHLLLEISPTGEVIATDLGSTNGTTINGVALRNPMPLQVGSILRCGDTTIRLEPRGRERVPPVVPPERAIVTTPATRRSPVDPPAPHPADAAASAAPPGDERTDPPVPTPPDESDAASAPVVEPE